MRSTEKSTHNTTIKVNGLNLPEIKDLSGLKETVPALKERINNLFTSSNALAISVFAILSRSLSFTWIFWDAILSHKLYKHQEVFPDQFLRFVRLGVGIGWFIGLISPLTAAVILAADGIISIVRYRQLKVTKSFIEDVPRIARIAVALLLVPAVGFL